MNFNPPVAVVLFIRIVLKLGTFRCWVIGSVLRRDESRAFCWKGFRIVGYDLTLIVSISIVSGTQDYR